MNILGVKKNVWFQGKVESVKKDPFWSLFFAIFIVVAISLSVYNHIPRAYPEAAESTLRANGYTNIEILGAGWTGCGISRRQTAYFNTKFRAMGPSGAMVEGRVCSGGLEAIQFD